jgi:hypothetical protein
MSFLQSTGSEDISSCFVTMCFGGCFEDEQQHIEQRLPIQHAVDITMISITTQLLLHVRSITVCIDR